MFQSLLAQDVRTIFHLLGECQELWMDPVAWQRHLLSGVSRLINLPVGILVRVREHNPDGSHKVLHMFENGWENPIHQQHFHRAMGLERLLLLNLNHSSGEPKSCGKAAPTVGTGVVDEYDARARPDFDECFGLAKMHQILFSVLPANEDGCHHGLVFGGAEHRPTKSDHQRLAFLHAELVILSGSRLAQSNQICLHGLSARRRDVFQLLLEGLPEKLIAHRLGLRPCTVSEHMQKLYAHFRVHSRSELLAYALRRAPASK